MAPVLEVRQRFPYSIVNEEQEFAGMCNRGARVPTVGVFDLDIQRPVPLCGFDARASVRLCHVFEYDVPRDVQGNIDSLTCGRFSNYIEQSVGMTFQLSL